MPSPPKKPMPRRRLVVTQDEAMKSYALTEADLLELEARGYVVPDAGLYDCGELRAGVTAMRTARRIEEREEAQSSLIKSALSHVEKIVDKYHKPISDLLALWAAEIDRSAKRCKELEERQTSMIESHEKMRLQERESQLAQMMVEAGIRRKDAAMDLLKKTVPQLAGQVKDSLIKRTLAEKLIESVLENPDQLGALIELDFLKPHQLEMLKAVLEQHGAKAKPEEQPAAESAADTRKGDQANGSVSR